MPLLDPDAVRPERELTEKQRILGELLLKEAGNAAKAFATLQEDWNKTAVAGLDSTAKTLAAAMNSKALVAAAQVLGDAKTHAMLNDLVRLAVQRPEPEPIRIALPPSRPTEPLPEYRALVSENTDLARQVQRLQAENADQIREIARLRRGDPFEGTAPYEPLAPDPN